MALTNEDFFLLRTPYLPIETLTAFNQHFEEGSSALLDLLVGYFKSDELREALFIASPELYREFEKYKNGQFGGKKDPAKLQQTLLKYLLRICTRCTPYGLFAGCSTGTVNSKTDIQFGENNSCRKYLRLDMNYLAQLSDVLSSIPVVKQQVRFFPNSSLYEAGDKYRYAEYTVTDKIRKYNLVSIDKIDILKELLPFTKNGATITAIVQLLRSLDIEQEDAQLFTEELIASQVLISELQPTVTGEDYLQILIQKIQSLDDCIEITDKLQELAGCLEGQDNSLSRYETIYKILNDLQVDTKQKDLIQVDLFRDMAVNQLSSSLVSDITVQLEKLSAINKLAKSQDLQEFKRQFSERYEEQEVPLELALDSELGIGYGRFTDFASAFTPLIENITVNGSNNGSSTYEMNPFRQWQLNKYFQAIEEQQKEIVITEQEINQLNRRRPVFPSSLYVFGSVLCETPEKADDLNYRFYFKNISGPSSANLLGRFCCGSPELSEKVKTAIRNSEPDKEGVIYAEIAHLPQARLGNILSRPHLRDYEIVYLANSSLSQDQQIPVTDLMVSVVNGKIVLRSKRLGKVVIPRLSTAHNFSFNSLPVYKFLCDTQFEDSEYNFYWRWEDILYNRKYFPRVRFEKIIISRAKWRLVPEDFNLTKEDNKNHESIDRKVTEGIAKWRKQLNIPSVVTITEGDNELLVNLDYKHYVELIKETLLKRGEIVLEENLHTDNLFITGPGGHFTNEVIFPLRATAPVDAVNKDSYTRAQKDAAVKRTFVPGSEWYFIKIYCGSNTAERIIKEVIKPVTDRLEKERLVDKWFFIRYADPDYHIRLRFYNERQPGFWLQVQEEFNRYSADLLQYGMIRKIQADTYVRELERYGTQTIELSESFFHYDSKCALDIISNIYGDEGELYRWLFAMRCIDRYLDGCGFELTDKKKAIDTMSRSFLYEFGNSAAMIRQLDDKYRQEMKRISSFLNPAEDDKNNISPLTQLIHNHAVHIDGFFKQIHSLETDENSRYTLNNLLSSYLHMFLNRLFVVNQRKHEMVIYYFLSKYYESKIARLQRNM